MRSSAEQISLVSTTSSDVVIHQDSGAREVIPGGPALFIGQALMREGLTYRECLADPITVEMLLTPDGEFGRIPSPSPPKTIPEDAISEWTIVSSIAGEWELPSNIRRGQRLFVDLQGFVRDPSAFGQKKRWQPAATVQPDVYCLKGTVQEVACLPDAVRADQMQRLLVVTNGAQSIEVFNEGKRTRIPCSPVGGLPNTIGAGDTFLGTLVAAMYRGLQPIAAARYAARQTERFLAEKMNSDS